MATQIVMPSFGMYTAEGTLVGWTRPDGSHVERGDPILEIETDKALNEVVAPAAGVLHHVARVGTIIKEEGLLGYILAEGESVPVENSPPPTVTTVITPHLGVGATRDGSTHASAANSTVKASPVARSMAKKHGIDLANIKGSGPGGRIVEGDVNAWFERLKHVTTHAVRPESGTRVALTNMRKSIGERLRWSINTAIPLTLTREAEADQLVTARKTISDTLRAPVPYDAFFLKIFGLALHQQPALNAMLDGDMLIRPDDVNIGFAVALPEGLVVPVIRKVDTLSVAEISDEIRRLTERARSNSLLADDVTGGTSTITNLGAYGVDSFTPILNPPQSSILGIGRIAQRAIAFDGQLSTGNTCWLSFTFDHRVTDGVPAAKMLDAIVRMINDTVLLSSFNNQ